MRPSFVMQDHHRDHQWRFVWFNSTGERQEHSVFKSKAKRNGWTKEIVRQQADAKMKRQIGVTASPATLGQTLADYGRSVLTSDRVSDHAGRTVQATTGTKDLECWEGTICKARDHRLPNIADMAMSQITRPVLIDFLNALRAKEGWSGNYKGTISHKLRIVIRRAVDMEVVPADCHGSRMAGKWISTDSEKSVRAQPLLTAEQVAAARAYLDSIPNAVTRLQSRLRFEIAMATGARPGEWMALRASDLTWLDADPDFCAVWSVRCAMGTRKDASGKSVAYLKDTKTKAGARDLLLPACLGPLLRQWIALQAEIRTSTTAQIDPAQQFLLTNQWGTMTTKQVMTGWWGDKDYGARNGAGLPGFTLYAFRSSFAANFRLANGNMVTLALKQLMGHVVGDVTGMYASTDDKSADRLAQRAELLKFLNRMNGTAAPQPHPVPGLIGNASGPVPQGPVPANDDATHPVGVAV